MNEHPLCTYLRAQGELGGSEVIVPFSEPLSEPRFSGFKDLQEEKPIKISPVTISQDESLWKSVSDLNSFYEALKKHPVYSKGMRGLSFWEYKEVKKDVDLLLLFHSPLELTIEARGILERLFKKVGVDLNLCAISFFLKCNDTALPREKNVLKEMLCKEVELMNPGKIIFFREAPKPEKIETPAPVSENITTFAGKPAITLYSLLEMLAGRPDFKEKMNFSLNNAIKISSIHNT